MESDGDDFELFVSSVSNSPPNCGRRLKRLKKSADVAVKSPPNPSDAGFESFVESDEQILDFPPVLEPDDDDEDSGFQQESAVVEGERLGFEVGEGSEVPVVGVKRGLKFDSSDEEKSEGRRDYVGGEEGNEGAVGIGANGGTASVDGDSDKVEKKKKKKKKKKERKKSRVKSSGEFDVGNNDCDSVDDDVYAVVKRVSEKARRNQLNQLRADSQKLLRESSDAGFKPVPLVHKPISSVLEKIRQRKLEFAKKTLPCKKSSFSFPFPDLMRDDIDLIADNEKIGRKAESIGAKGVSRISVASSSHAEINVNALQVDESNNTSSKTNHVDVPSQEEGIKQSYRSTVDDTQDLFSDSESDHTKDDLAGNPRRLTEEVFAPSLLAMNLELDSAPQDESSDEDDHDKENIDPLLHQSDDFSLTSLGDPVKNFIDVEAEEEDDSDNDMIRFQENEEEDTDDLEELNDMIAPDFKEGDVDREMRNKLHQKWLEQQDATVTEELLQRLNCGPKKTNAGLDDLMDDDDEDGTHYEDEIEELSEDDLEPGNVARINFRKVQQMIPQMFTDNEDAYVSSEDEEFEKLIAKQNLLLKTEFQGSLVSPAEDENSREVFRLIKKLNIVPPNKKRAKSSVLDDNTHIGGRPNDLLKPSFLGRGSTSLPSSKNRKTNSFKGFIFGRDDSNSKSPISTCEDSDTIEPDAKPSRTSSSAKLRSSQSRHSSQSTTNSAASSTTSLYDILRRSSMQSEQCARSASVNQPNSIFSAFRVGRKSNEGRVPM